MSCRRVAASSRSVYATSRSLEIRVLRVAGTGLDCLVGLLFTLLVMAFRAHGDWGPGVAGEDENRPLP
jgi:hypothetical protein